jgi:hypothetical protein
MWQQRQRLLTTAVGVALWILGLWCVSFLPSQHLGRIERLRWLSPSDLALIHDESAGVHSEGNLLAVGERGGQLALATTPLAGAVYVELVGRPLVPFPFHQVIVHYAANRLWQSHLETRADFIMRRGIRPIVSVTGQRLHWRWYLPVSANVVRLDFPPQARLKWDYLELRGRLPTAAERGSPSQEAIDLFPTFAWPVALRLFVWGILLALAWSLLRLWLPLPKCDYPAVQRCLIVLIGAKGILLALLLPPFQAPDENRHWQAALQLYRERAQEETPLFHLPELLGALPPRWLAYEPFYAGRLRNQVPESEPTEGVSVGYGSRLTYPLVGLVVGLWPRVATIEEALIVYYLCRLLAVAALVIVLWSGLSGGMVGMTLLMFAATPLMLQQSAAVTSDTVVNLGSLVTAFLFVAAWREPSWRRQALVWLAAGLVTAAKPPTALLLLPLALLPWRRLPLKVVFIPLLIVLGLAAVYWALELGVQLVIRSDPSRAPHVQAQYQLVKQGPGLENFWTALRGLLPPAWNQWDAWYQYHQPLGWLDTNVGTLHRLLIYLGLGLGLLLDGLRGWQVWLQAARQRPGELLILLAIGLVHAVALVLGISLLLFLANTPPGQAHFVGVQHRYFFPALLVLLTLPAALQRESGGARNGGRAWSDFLGGTVASLLLPLLAARMVLLMIDIQTRYSP